MASSKTRRMKLVKTPTSKLSESEWQDLRYKFTTSGKVGGSDAGTLLGLNKYKSAINLFYQAVGIVRLPNKMNSAMLHGKQLEDYVASCWEYWDGTEEGWVNNTLENKKVQRCRRIRAIIENPKYPTLFANIDREITFHPVRGKEKGILEIKTISGYSADAYDTGIPPSYFLQAQLYMLVMGHNYAEICYLKDGRDIGVVFIEADTDQQQLILSASADHYQRVRLAQAAIQEFKDSGAWSGDPEELYGIAQEFEPPADDSEAYKYFISERHKARENENVIIGTDDDRFDAHAYVELKNRIAKLEAEKQLHENRLRARLQHNNAQVIQLEGGKVTWRKQFSVKL